MQLTKYNGLLFIYLSSFRFIVRSIPNIYYYHYYEGAQFIYKASMF